MSHRDVPCGTLHQGGPEDTPVTISVEESRRLHTRTHTSTHAMSCEAMLENACRESPGVGLLVSKEAGLVMKLLVKKRHENRLAY